MGLKLKTSVVVGWGLNESGGEIMTVLQQVDLQIFSSYDCAARHNPGWFVDGIFCQYFMKKYIYSSGSYPRTSVQALKRAERDSVVVRTNL